MALVAKEVFAVLEGESAGWNVGAIEVVDRRIRPIYLQALGRPRSPSDEPLR